MLWLLLFAGVLGLAWFLFVPDPGRNRDGERDANRDRQVSRNMSGRQTDDLAGLGNRGETEVIPETQAMTDVMADSVSDPVSYLPPFVDSGGNPSSPEQRDQHPS